MSEPLKYAIAIAGFVVIDSSYVIAVWKSAEREARKEIDRLTPPKGLSLNATATRWLTALLAQHTRWSALVTGPVAIGLAAIVFLFHDVPLIDEAGGMMFGFAVGAGYLIGGTMATVASARTGLGARRSATLGVRSLRTYLRAWEHRPQSVAVAAICVALSVWLWSVDVLDAFYLGLAVTWLSLIASIICLQRWVVRTSPVVDEELHLARELTISISVRTLACYQPLWATLITFVGATYAYLHSGLPWIASVAPLYIAGAAAVAFRLARSDRHGRGRPDPAWHFARTLEPTP